MIKTTVSLPEGLDLRLEARADSAGTSKAELVRQPVTRLLDEEQPARDLLVFPVFNSGQAMTPEEMDQAMTDLRKHMAESAARR